MPRFSFDTLFDKNIFFSHAKKTSVNHIELTSRKFKWLVCNYGFSRTMQACMLKACSRLVSLPRGTLNMAALRAPVLQGGHHKDTQTDETEMLIDQNGKASENTFDSCSDYSYFCSVSSCVSSDRRQGRHRQTVQPFSYCKTAFQHNHSDSLSYGYGRTP